MNTFENYLNEPFSLDFAQMQSLHNELLEEVGSDTNALKLYGDLVDHATKYAAIRAGWLRMPTQEKMDTDSLRTSLHDSVIIYFNILARYLRMHGKKAQWRDRLGDETQNRYCRKTIGDFGCYIVFVNSLCAR